MKITELLNENQEGVAEGSVDHRALGKHHEEMTDQELRKVGSKLPDSWDAAVLRRKLASHPKYAQALKHYDKSEYHFGKAAKQGVAEGKDIEVTHNGENIGTIWRNGREVQGEHNKSGMSWAGGTPASMAQHLKNHHDSWVAHQARKKQQGVAEARHENFDDLYGSFPDLRKDKKTGEYHLVHLASNHELVLHQDGRFKPLTKDGEAYIKRMTGEEKLDELSPQTLASYKQKAGAQASELDKRAFHKDTEPEQAKRDISKANKRFSGIVRATRKEFGR